MGAPPSKPDRDADRTAPLPSHDEGAGSAPQQPARVLVVIEDAGLRQSVVDALRDGSVTVDPVASAQEAAGAIAGAAYDAALIQLRLADARGLDVLRALTQEQPAARAVMIGPEPELRDAVEAMRLGAVDLLSAAAPETEILASVLTAIERGRSERQRDRRVERLQRLCRVLNTAREDVARHVESLCDDLATAYRDLSDQITHSSLAAEFTAAIEHELDIESLLRAGLEFMLSRTGPTNAAVFLPSNHADFSLGAFVNYDCPKDSVEMLFDHLADVLAPKFQDALDVERIDCSDDLETWIGDDANWLAESTAIVFACRHEQETLAVVAFFREQGSPFPDPLLDDLRILRSIFAEQLAKVVRVHHRHKPEADWLDGVDEDEDDFGLAA